ncbi:hypothetical protein GCM10020295_79140 [Streptomyces cinereospinus]
MRVDQGAAQAELGDRPFQFLRRRLRVLQGQGREAGEPGGMLRDQTSQQIVDGGGLCHRGGGVRLGLDAGGREGQDLHVEAGRVHLGQTFPGQIEQPPGRLPPLVGLTDRRPRTVAQQVRRDEVLFETNGPQRDTPFTIVNRLHRW